MNLLRSCAAVLVVVYVAGAAAAGEFADWSRYRGTVEHPALTIKSADLARARENIKRYPWAKEYAASVEKRAREDLARLTDRYVEQMIPETTPGSRIFTPCPACRDQGKPYLPQGQWTWDPSHPDELKCAVCGTVYPNDKYAETVEVRTNWGHPQVLKFYGGRTFEVFGYKQGRPSFSGNIRAQKVLYMADVARHLAEAYALTGDVKFADATKRVLLRFADEYPYWLVHVGYGEYADMDPVVAARNIEHLPVDEAVYPPNRPDRKLHTGFWTAGRATGTGQESWFVRRVTDAYDLTCGAGGIWSDAEREKVEKDLLLESTKLLTADTSINNKSVGNRTAAALVGMCVGEPGLVRFGLEGFNETVEHWFLPDGGTPESWAYAEMTLNGLEELPLAARGYSDPSGYRDAKGGRLDHFDLYHQPAYARVWESMFNGMQGDLRYPPLADSYPFTTIGPRKAEIMAANYPDRPEYLALLKAVWGDDQRGDPSASLYLREPSLERKPAPRLVMKDYCWPDMRIGYLRTGDDGRESLLTLSASHWGNHHHDDSLNLYYWKDGQELLSDLGYLWDHPEKHVVGRTVAHNTVVVDEADQAEKERGGEVEFFETGPHVKAMRASSHAYTQATTYERTTVLVDHGGGRSYAVDFFRVQGGKVRDYVFHGVNRDWKTVGATLAPSDEKLYDFTHVQRLSPAAGGWKIMWTLPGHEVFDAYAVPTAGGEDGEAFVADGWGQRDYKNSDLGVQIPYVVRRCTGPGETTFVSVFEGHRDGAAVVKGVRRRGDAVVVERTDGGVDYVASGTGASTDIITASGPVRMTGKVAVISEQDGKEVWRFVK